MEGSNHLSALPALQTPIARSARQADWRSYSLAVVSYGAAFILRYALDGLLPPGFPYLTFFPAIVIVTYCLGTGPGILCALLSGVTAWYVFLPPAFSFALTWQTGLAIGFFIFIAAVDIFLIDRMVRATMALERARGIAEGLARQRDDLFSELQHRVGNNLMMVAGMLRVQARASSNEAAKLALADASRRISVVSDINRLFLNPNHSVNRIDSGSVTELAGKVLASNAAESRIRLNVDIETLLLGQDKFLPVTLTIVEAIANAVEHAYGEERAGS